MKQYIAHPAREHLKLVVDDFMSNWVGSGGGVGEFQCVGTFDSLHNQCTKELDYLVGKGTNHECKFLVVRICWLAV